MSGKSFEEKLKEREAAIRQKWAAQSKAKKIGPTETSADADVSPAAEKPGMTVKQRLVHGIKTGRLKSKSPDGYLVLKGEFYDAIESGKKRIEYREFTEYNIKRTIGLKTIRFNRGYVKNAPQMQWEVEKVVLLDGDDNACDPFNVPEDFCPTTIAIHLGNRLQKEE